MGPLGVIYLTCHKLINKNRLLVAEFFFSFFFRSVVLRKHLPTCFFFVPAEILKEKHSVCAAGGWSTMLLDGLWTVHALLALSSLALGNSVSNDPLAAPRVFISFKGRNLSLILHSLPLACLSFLVSKSSYSLPVT